MANPPITRFTSLAVATTQNSGNPNNGLYAPELTQDQITNIPLGTRKNGGLWYNSKLDQLEAVIKNTIQPIQVGAGVVGPGVSVAGDIAIFADTTGNVIADSGVNIKQVPALSPPLLKSSKSLELSNINVNEISNIGHIKFTNDVGIIFVDSLMPVEFITNDTGSEEQVCSLFTGGLPSSSTSPSALVELQSDSGGLLLSRMTTTERNALLTPSGSNGLLLFNTTSKTFDGFDGTSWRSLPQVIDDGSNFFIGTNAGKFPLTGTLNTGVGVNALDSITSGNKNTAVGNSALMANTAPNDNSAFGNQALRNNIEGLGSCAFGSESLQSNVIGSGNAAFGYQALQKNINGIGSSAFGYKALLNNLASNNSAFGNGALNANTTGVSNTAFGSASLSVNLVGSYNSAFGIGALSSNTASNNSAFGNLALLNNTADSNSAFGHLALFSNTGGTPNCAFGSAALYSNQTGAFNAAFGDTALYTNVNGINNAAFGSAALFSNTVSNNSAFGSLALTANQTGAQNCAFGSGALSTNIIGNNCSAFGYQALQNNLSHNSSAFGYQALQNNTGVGVSNNAFGYQALNANTTGLTNCAFGTSALASNVIGGSNCAFGNEALRNNTGGNNCAFGRQTLFSNVIGNENAAFGYSAMNNINGSRNCALGTVTGGLQPNLNNCVFIGYAAIASLDNLTNAVAIGYQASVGASNCMVLGGTSANQLSVGIGITPNAQLQLPTIHANRKLVLYETANNDHQVFGLGTASGIFRYQIDNTTSNYIWNAAASSSASNELARLTGTGYLLVGATSSTAQIVATGGVQNVASEGSCIRASSALGVTKIELENTNSSTKLWEMRSLASGNLEVAYRTGTITPYAIDTGGTSYSKQSYASYYATGGVGTTMSGTPGTFVKLAWPTTAAQSVLNNYSTALNGGNAFTWNNATSLAKAAQSITVSFSATHNGVAGETTTFIIFRNGSTVIASRAFILVTASVTTLQVVLNVVSPVTTTADFFDIRANHTVASRLVTITDINFTISST